VFVLRDNLKTIEPSENCLASADLAYPDDSKAVSLDWDREYVRTVLQPTTIAQIIVETERILLSAAMDEGPGICSMSQPDQMNWLILHLYKTFLLCSLLALASAETNWVVK
jgi:hypothetical protein